MSHLGNVDAGNEKLEMLHYWKRRHVTTRRILLMKLTFSGFVLAIENCQLRKNAHLNQMSDKAAE
jgi:hypothetical protein